MHLEILSKRIPRNSSVLIRDICYQGRMFITQAAHMYCKDECRLAKLSNSSLKLGIAWHEITYLPILGRYANIHDSNNSTL